MRSSAMNQEGIGAGAGSAGEKTWQSAHTGGGKTIREKIGSEVKERVKSLLEDQKMTASERLHAVAEAIRKSAEDLASSQQPALAGFAEKAADTIEDLTGRLRAQDVEVVLDRGVDYVKRHPVVMFGGALALGFIAIRIARNGLKRAPGAAAGTTPASLH